MIVLVIKGRVFAHYYIRANADEDRKWDLYGLHVDVPPTE
jgi:hypothetical protein